MLCSKENIEGKWQEITLSSALGNGEEARKELHIPIFEMQKPVMQCFKAAKPKLDGKKCDS